MTRWRTLRVCRWAGVAATLLVLVAWIAGVFWEARYQSWDRAEWFVRVGSGGFNLQRLSNEFVSEEKFQEFQSLQEIYQAESILVVPPYESIVIVPRAVGWRVQPVSSGARWRARLGLSRPRVLFRSLILDGFCTSRRASIAIPFWLFFAGAAAPTAYLYWRDRLRHRPGTGCCCGYDLHGNVSGRCPECGVAVCENAHAELTPSSERLRK